MAATHDELEGGQAKHLVSAFSAPRDVAGAPGGRLVGRVASGARIHQ
eukprot:CAMPEP_0115553190 /NCGR_PEP_ID=MMETSP0271-20121206/96640_1 /TAXON_ID=71861 /ORGANISM="Scrippsiella trochoidea, Strain CCMP3099" /LENGTH=46 /DNA_ID= /DNA_START= /DNA_END= /DNA_ORIENTATION=